MKKLMKFIVGSIAVLLLICLTVGLVGAYLYFYKQNSNNNNIMTKTSSSNSTTIISTITLSSSAFGNGGMIPSKYTCDNSNTNGIIPPLSISGVPSETKSLVLILDDPDTQMGTFTHWVKWNIPPSTIEIKEGMEPLGISGKGSSGERKYIGPCPPTGTHHYRFKLYAVDILLHLPENSDADKVMSVIRGHILDQTEMIGLYTKQTTK